MSSSDDDDNDVEIVRRDLYEVLCITKQEIADGGDKIIKKVGTSVVCFCQSICHIVIVYYIVL
jgi:hypothetical protein